MNPLNQVNIDILNNRINNYQSNNQGIPMINPELDREKREQLKKLMKQTQQHILYQPSYYSQLVPQRRSSNNNNIQTQNQSQNQNQNSQKNTSQNNEQKTNKK